MYPRVLTSVILAATPLLGSCSLLFDPVEVMASHEFPWPDSTPVRTATRSEVAVVHEDPGRVAVLHGSTCAESTRDGQQDFVRVQEAIDFTELLENDPGWITNATVFLNGWRTRFLHGKEKILGVSAAVARIDHQRMHLFFEGGGALSDGKFDAQYELCYTFSVLAWNRGVVDIQADHGDPGNAFVLMTDDNPSVTSLNVLRNYRQGLAFIEENTPTGLLPRGFGMAWGSGSQMLQAAYAMGTPANILSSSGDYGPLAPPDALTENATRQGAGGISWDSSIIFKPNDYRSDIYVAELVSILGGDSLAMIHPALAIEPANEKDDDCGGLFTGCIENPPDTSGPQTWDLTIENLPFAYAVPVLLGWSLGYMTDDHTIRDLGITIDRFSYDRPAGSDTGTLTYSVTAVADNLENFTPRLLHRVGILGLDR